MNHRGPLSPQCYSFVQKQLLPPPTPWGQEETTRAAAAFLKSLVSERPCQPLPVVFWGAKLEPGLNLSPSVSSLSFGLTAGLCEWVSWGAAPLSQPLWQLSSLWGPPSQREAPLVTQAPPHPPRITCQRRTPLNPWVHCIFPKPLWCGLYKWPWGPGRVWLSSICKH